MLLLIPVIAMQFNTEVYWTALDFELTGCLLFSLGLLLNYINLKIKKAGYKIPIVFAIVILSVLLWVELAVVIFGTPFAGR